MKIVFECEGGRNDDEICIMMRYMEDHGFHIIRMAKIPIEQEIRDIKKRLDELENKNKN